MTDPKPAKHSEKLLQEKILSLEKKTAKRAIRHLITVMRYECPFAEGTYINEIIYLRKRQFLLSCSKSLLTFWTNVFELRIAIREHIALDDTGIPQTCSFTTSGTIDVCFRYGSTSGTKNIFLHDRHLSFYVIF